MMENLMGEFKGKNTVYRVLADGKMEVSGTGTGKILGMDAFMRTTSIGIMQNGIFRGEVYSSNNNGGWSNDKHESIRSRLSLWERRH